MQKRILKYLIIAFMMGFLINKVNPIIAFDSRNFTSEEKLNVSIYKKAGPSVVKITTSSLLFNFSLGDIPDDSSGSGIIIDPKGYILTNRHVIENAARLNVILSDHSKYPATVIGSDPDNDLAVIKISPPNEKKLHALDIGNSSTLEVGQKVIAIGDPFGFDGTMTTGIISNIGRELKSKNGRIIQNIIQTDAAINPGNSGGPLIDTKGQLIGINTAIFSPSSASAGIGFAIPSSTIKRVIADLLKYGFVKKPYLGISDIMPINNYYSRLLGLPEEKGFLIRQVQPNSPADKASLQCGNRIINVNKLGISPASDVILSIDENKFKDVSELMSYIESKKNGDVLKFSIFRDNKIKNIDIKLEEAAVSHQ
ncbi:MAG: trypsin-like peptidase domain-containing protein [Candidatus Gastranaerophilaceae bacterium]|jgi:putative serine protease PepD